MVKLGFSIKVLVCYRLFRLALPFSVTSEASLIQDQLGYLPTNFVSVSAWTLDKKEPVAIKTYPLHGGAKRRRAKAEVAGSISSPFPTLYWLCSPEISKAVANLERRGFIQEFEQELKSDATLCLRLLKCHEEYAMDRWNSLKEEDRSLLCQADSSIARMRNIMQQSGISGSNFTVFQDTEEDDEMRVPPIKCLHAHYAQYRSTMSSEACQNPVGEMIHERLMQEFPDLQL